VWHRQNVWSTSKDLNDLAWFSHAAITNTSKRTEGPHLKGHVLVYMHIATCHTEVCVGTGNDIKHVTAFFGKV